MTDYDSKRIEEIIAALRYAGMPKSATDLGMIKDRILNSICLEYKGLRVNKYCEADATCVNKTAWLWVCDGNDIFTPVCSEHVGQIAGNPYWRIEPLPGVAIPILEPMPTKRPCRMIEV